MIPSTADLQNLTRPLVEQVFAALGHTITVTPASLSTGPGPSGVDRDGNPVPATGGPPTPAAGTDFPGFAYQVPNEKRRQYGSTESDLNVPLWEVLVRWDAPLDTPGWHLTAAGAGLDNPVQLAAVGDAENIGSQRVCWRVLCHASRALEGS